MDSGYQTYLRRFISRGYAVRCLSLGLELAIVLEPWTNEAEAPQSSTWKKWGWKFAYMLIERGAVVLTRAGVRWIWGNRADHALWHYHASLWSDETIESICRAARRFEIEHPAGSENALSQETSDNDEWAEQCLQELVSGTVQCALQV